MIEVTIFLTTFIVEHLLTRKSQPIVCLHSNKQYTLTAQLPRKGVFRTSYASSSLVVSHLSLRTISIYRRLLSFIFEKSLRLSVCLASVSFLVCHFRVPFRVNHYISSCCILLDSPSASSVPFLL